MAGNWGQIDKVDCSTTSYKWLIELFDQELQPEPFYLTHDYSNVHHNWRKKLMSQSFMAGENIGIKSLWRIEIDNCIDKMINGEMIDFAGGFKATLIFENWIGTGTAKVAPFSCHPTVSILHPQTFVLINNFLPDNKVMAIQSNGEKEEFEISHHDVLEGVVEKTVCISVQLEIFGNDYSGASASGGWDFGITNLQQDFENMLME